MRGGDRFPGGNAGAAPARARLSGRCLVGGSARGDLLFSDVGLSFWGGVDVATGEVIDRHHPLNSRSLAGRILAIPGGRGSCSGSNVLLELLLNGHAPAGLIFEEDEAILTLGVIVADELFGRSIPVVNLSKGGFAALRGARQAEIRDGTVLVSDQAKPPTAPAAISFPPPSAASVRLSPLDQAFLDGLHGEAARLAMRIILRMAALQGADRLIDVAQAHIDGCLYTGPAGLRFARKLRDLGAEVRVPTSLNAISVDERQWRAQGADPEQAALAVELAQAYVDMGARPTFTCAPYLLDSAPRAGEQVAWSESNAVVFANSVLAARTLKYPDYLDICLALTGRAPLSGCHLDMNRRAKLVVAVERIPEADDAFYPLLGYVVGGIAGGLIPAVTGLEGMAPSLDDLKAFGAAFATTSGAPMFHIVGVTPEAPTLEAALGEGAPPERRKVGRAELAAAWRGLNTARNEAVELVSLGNPHFSLTECQRLAELCRGKRRHDSVRVIVTLGRDTLERARATGVLAELAAFGVEFVADACWCTLAEPVFPPATEALITNSAKYAHYGPGLVKRPVRFASLAACVAAAGSGRADTQVPAWLR